MLEAGVLIGIDHEPIHWHQPFGRSSVYIPDTRELWDQIWSHRHIVLGFAHTHPGSGQPTPSQTDLTTFDAIDNALGFRLLWWISSGDQTMVYRHMGPGKFDYTGVRHEYEPYWAGHLRHISGFPTE